MNTLYNVTLVSIPQSADEKPVGKTAILEYHDMIHVIDEKVDEHHYVMISAVSSDYSVFDD